MPLNLPKPIALYLAAANAGDTTTVAQYFSADAVVKDEGKTIQGIEAIRCWMADTREKYHHIMEPLALKEQGRAAFVTTRLTGSFPGSPIEVGFRFELNTGKIAKLTIG
jgi:ketosteroid isomerase-like protein